jgi:hypothetical protein
MPGAEGFMLKLDGGSVLIIVLGVMNAAAGPWVARAVVLALVDPAARRSLRSRSLWLLQVVEFELLAALLLLGGVNGLGLLPQRFAPRRSKCLWDWALFWEGSRSPSLPWSWA